MSSFSLSSNSELTRLSISPAHTPTPPTPPLPEQPEKMSERATTFGSRAPESAPLPVMETIHHHIDASTPEIVTEIHKELRAAELIPEALETHQPNPPLPVTRPSDFLPELHLKAENMRVRASETRFASLESYEHNRLTTSRAQVAAEKTADREALQHTELPLFSVPIAADFQSGELLGSRGKPLAFKQLLKDRFAEVEKSARHVLKTSTEKKLLAQAQKEAFRLASTARPEGDLLFKLATLPAEQLRDELACSLSALRPEKYGPGVRYADLSPRKQALVDAMLAGFQAGLEKQSYAVYQAISKQMLQRLREHLRAEGPDSDLIFSLTLKSKLDIMGELGVKMGLVSQDIIEAAKKDFSSYAMPERAYEWLEEIPLKQRVLLERLSADLLTQLNHGLPNHPSPEKLSLTVDGEVKQIPVQIVLKGKTYEKPELIGRGGQGLILKYTDLESGEPVVVKAQLNPAARNDMVQELRVHRHVMGGEESTGHEHVIAMRGVVRGHDESLYMVMDFAGGGDLETIGMSIIQASEVGVLPFRARIALAQHLLQEALTGMRYMQSRAMIHMDIKPANFLLDDQGKVLLSDFGGGKLKTAILDRNEKDEVTAFSYSLPEWDQGLSQKSDIYLLGITLRNIISGTYTELKPIPGQLGTDLSFINAMLSADPHQRPTLEALASSSFIQDAQIQDAQKMQDLLQAVLAYNQAIGKQNRKFVHMLSKQEEVLSRTERLLQAAITAHESNDIKRLNDKIQALKQEIAEIHEQVSLLSTRPDVKPLAEALRQAAQGLV